MLSIRSNHNALESEVIFLVTLEKLRSMPEFLKSPPGRVQTLLNIKEMYPKLWWSSSEKTLEKALREEQDYLNQHFERQRND
jgi:hypothetical protein